MDGASGRRRRDASENLSRSCGRTVKCTPAPAVTAGFYKKNDPDPAGVPQESRGNLPLPLPCNTLIYSCDITSVKCLLHLHLLLLL